MLRRCLAVLAVAAALTAVSKAPAEAAPMPCTGDRLVQVVDGPNWQREDGLVLNIGYLFPGCFGEGRWIGYIGRSDRYVPLDESDLRFLVEKAGLTAVPATPQRRDYVMQAFMGEVIGLSLAILVLGWNVLWPARRSQTATA